MITHGQNGIIECHDTLRDILNNCCRIAHIQDLDDRRNKRAVKSVQCACVLACSYICGFQINPDGFACIIQQLCRCLKLRDASIVERALWGVWWSDFIFEARDECCRPCVKCCDLVINKGFGDLCGFNPEMPQNQLMD